MLDEFKVQCGGYQCAGDAGFQWGRASVCGGCDEVRDGARALDFAFLRMYEGKRVGVKAKGDQRGLMCIAFVS